MKMACQCKEDLWITDLVSLSQVKSAALVVTQAPDVQVTLDI